MGKITAIGEFKNPHASIVASLDDVFTCFQVVVEKYRYHTSIMHGLHHLHLIEFRHILFLIT